MTEFVGDDLDMNGVKITGLATCTVGADAANKAYVDGAISGAAVVAGAGLTEAPAGTLNVANTDANLTISANSVDFSAAAAAVVAAGPAAPLANVAPPVVNTSGSSTLGVSTDAAREDHTHGIALATTSLQGAMSATDKSHLVNYFNNGFYNVLDHGISPAGTAAANLTAMNALLTLATGNSTIYFPPSTTAYQFSNVVTIPAKSFRFLGGGLSKTIIETTHATANMFTVGATGTEFRGLRFGSTVTRTGGAVISSGNFAALNVYECYFVSQFGGIAYSGGAASGVDCVVADCYFINIDQSALEIQGPSSSVQVSNCVGDCASGFTSNYIHLIESASFTMSDCWWKNAAVNFRIDPNSGTKSVRNVSVTNTTFELATAESVKFLAGAAGVTTKSVMFDNCRFNGNVNAVEIAGSAATVKATGIRFSNSEFLGNARGIYALFVQDFSVSNCLFSGNATAGLDISAATGSVTKFVISNCVIGPGGGFGGNAIGISIASGTYGAYAISNNHVAGNTSNQNIIDAGTVATTDLKKIINNTGDLIQGTIASNRGGVTSGTAETLLFNARIPAKSVLAGQVFRFTVWGQTSDVGTLIFRVRAGAAGTVAGDTTVISLQATTAAQVANAWQCFSGLVRVVTTGSSGTIAAQGEVLANGLVTSQAAAAETLATVNTTNAWFIDLTCATAVAGTFTVRNGVVEVL